MSLGAKLTLWVLLPSLLLLTVFAVTTVHRDQEFHQRETWGGVERLANALAIPATDALRRKSFEELPRLAERAALDPGRFGLTIFGRDGQPLLRWGLGSTGSTLPREELAALAKERRGVGRIERQGELPLRTHTVALTADGEPVGGLRVSAGLQELEAALGREQDYFLGMLSLTSLVLIAVIAVAIRRTVTLPLARLMTRLTALGGETPVSEIPVSGTDEVARLTREFNALARRLQEARRRLVQEREYAQNVIESISDGILGVDRECRIRTWNRALTERYGISEADVLGLNLFEAFPVLEREQLHREIQRVLTGATREFLLRHLEHETRQRGRCILNIRGSALRGPTDEIAGAVLAIEDVTDRVSLAQEIQQTEKLVVVGQLAAGIAHQIGTPLNVISGSAEYLMMEWGTERPRPQELEIIVAQTDRITRLIQQLLNFARPARMEFQPLDLNALLREVLELTEHQIAKGRIRVRTDLHPGLPPIPGDTNQLEQAFLNIVINAWHAMPGGGELTLRTRPAPADRVRRPSRAGGGGVEVVIADSGVGIPAEHLPRIFDPFFSTKGVGKGTGLGLAISRRILEDHRGSIEVESTVGQGTLFTIWLPVGE